MKKLSDKILTLYVAKNICTKNVGEPYFKETCDKPAIGTVYFGMRNYPMCEKHRDAFLKQESRK